MTSALAAARWPGPGHCPSSQLTDLSERGGRQAGLGGRACRDPGQTPAPIHPVLWRRGKPLGRGWSLSVATYWGDLGQTSLSSPSPGKDNDAGQAARRGQMRGAGQAHGRASGGGKAPAPCPSSSLRVQPPKQPCTHPFTAHPEVSGAPFGPASRSPAPPTLADPVRPRHRAPLHPLLSCFSSGRFLPSSSCQMSFQVKGIPKEKAARAREERVRSVKFAYSRTHSFIHPSLR